MSESGAVGVNPFEAGALDDEDRLVLAARTDRRAFGMLYDRYFDATYHYIARRVGDADAAEDLAAATWERALAAIARYEIRGTPFAAWLYRIAGNLVANYHRRRGLHPEVDLATYTSADAPPSDLEEREAVLSALHELSESDQEVLSLCYYAGLSPTEIAAVLDCSVAAAHKRLHRARLRLRDRFEAGPGVG